MPDLVASDNASTESVCLSTAWFDACFGKAPTPVPADLRAVSTAFCKVYQVKGPTAPLDVANSLAIALARGDGRGRFECDGGQMGAQQLRHATCLLAQAYAQEIAASRARQGVADVISMSLRAAQARPASIAKAAANARPG